MATTIKWTSIFRGDTGDAFIVQIFDVNHNGNPRQYTLGSKPVEIKWDGKGEDRFSPIIGSSAVVEFVIQNDTERVYWRDVFASYQEQEVFLRVLTIPVDPDMQGVIVWSGWLLGDLCTEEQDEYPWLLKLKFTDSIALLKDHFFCADDTTEPITNYEDEYNSFAYWIVDSLKKINVGGDGASFLDLTPIGNGSPLKTFVHWYNSEVSPTSMSYDPIEKFGCRPRPFWDVNDAGQIKPKSCYDAIEMFCKVWGARFVFFNNKYHFIQINFYFHSNYDVQSTPAIRDGYLYDWAVDSSLEKFESETNLEYEAKIRPSYFKTMNTLMGGKQTFYPPLKRVFSTYGRWMGINLLTTCPATASTSNVDGWRGNLDMGESYDLGTFEEDSTMVFRLKWLTIVTNQGVGYNSNDNMQGSNFPVGYMFGYAGAPYNPQTPAPEMQCMPEIRFTLQITNIATGDVNAIGFWTTAGGGYYQAPGLVNWTNYLLDPYPTCKVDGTDPASCGWMTGSWPTTIQPNTLSDVGLQLELSPTGIAGLDASAGGYSLSIHFFDVTGGASFTSGSSTYGNSWGSPPWFCGSTFGGWGVANVGAGWLGRMNEKKDLWNSARGAYIDVKGLNTGTLGADITYDPALQGSALYPSGLEAGIFHIDANGQYTGAPFTWIIDNNGTGASVVASTLEYKTGALLFGDGRHTNSFGAIKYDDGSGGWADPAYEGWARDLPSGGDFITELLGKEILLGQMNLTSKFEFTITRSGKVVNAGHIPRITPLTRVQYRGYNLLPLRCAWNLITDEWKGKWFEVSEASVDNIAPAADMIGAGSADIAGVPAGGSLQRRAPSNSGGGLLLTRTASNITAGAIISIPINPITIGQLESDTDQGLSGIALLKAGDRVLLFATLTGTPAEFEGTNRNFKIYILILTADQKYDDTTLSVESVTFDLDVVAGSALYLQQSEIAQKALGARAINVLELSQTPQCWYDISDDSTLTITAQNLVSAITNKAVDGTNDLTYGGAAALYDVATLKKPSINFNGTDNYYTLTGLSSLQNFEFWMVIHPDTDWLTNNNYMSFFGHSNGQNYIRTQNAISNYQFKVGNVSNNTGTLRASIVAGKTQIIRFFRSVAEGAEGYDIIDSVEINGIGSGDAYTVEEFAADGTFSRIGARNTLAEASFLDGNIGEILMYDETLTPNNAAKILNYLQNKWL